MLDNRRHYWSWNYLHIESTWFTFGCIWGVCCLICFLFFLCSVLQFIVCFVVVVARFRLLMLLSSSINDFWFLVKLFLAIFCMLQTVVVKVYFIYYNSLPKGFVVFVLKQKFFQFFSANEKCRVTDVDITLKSQETTVSTSNCF